MAGATGRSALNLRSRRIKDVLGDLVAAQGVRLRYREATRTDALLPCPPTRTSRASLRPSSADGRTARGQTYDAYEGKAGAERRGKGQRPTAAGLKRGQMAF